MSNQINSPEKPFGTTTQHLLKKSAEFASVVTDIAMDEDYIVRCEIQADEMRPFTTKDIPSDAFGYRGASHAGFYSYEDAGIATGEFLASQAIRYKVTHDTAAYENAQRAFAGIRFIYNLGKKHKEGFFPKPYDKKISQQISRDQYLFVMTGMKEYYDIADSQTRSEIERMMGTMGNYWINIDYRHTYLSLPASSQLTDFMGSLFLGIIRIAYEFSNDPVLLREYYRLLTEERLGSRMSETLRGLFLSGKTYDGGTYFRSNEHSITMKTIATDSLWEYDPEHINIWQEALQKFWDDDLLVSFDPQDGLCYFVMKFDPKTNKTCTVSPGIIPELENPLNLACLNWGGHHKTAISVMLAYSATVIGNRLGNTSAINTAKSILEKLNLNSFRGFLVPDSSHYPPGEEYRGKILNISFLCTWQWAYWLGRQRNFW
ncbi:MAG: hypothetical protein ACYC54_15055 [Sedimentisphaerales bacterium]